MIKYEIGKCLGIHPQTVKRNRKGRYREWYRVRFVTRFESREQALKAQSEMLHPVHRWPLFMCGYKMRPAKLQKEWVLLRSSAARVLDLPIVQRCGKSKRLRRLTNHLAKTGSGIGSSGVYTFEAHDTERCTNFRPSATDVPKALESIKPKVSTLRESIGTKWRIIAPRSVQ